MSLTSEYIRYYKSVRNNNRAQAIFTAYWLLFNFINHIWLKNKDIALLQCYSSRLIETLIKDNNEIIKDNNETKMAYDRLKNYPDFKELVSNRDEYTQKKKEMERIQKDTQSRTLRQNVFVPSSPEGSALKNTVRSKSSSVSQQSPRSATSLDDIEIRFSPEKTGGATHRLAQKTVKELQALCAKKKLSYSGLRKAELIAKLSIK